MVDIHAGEFHIVESGGSQQRVARLELSAVTLMATTAATAGIGIVFWAAAARLYPASEVGRGSAVLTSATLIGALATIGLGNVYARFLALAGRETRRLISRGYLAVSVLAAVAGTLFLSLPPAARLLPTTLDRVGFPILAAILALFALQDDILVGMRAPGWVAAENITFAVAKLGLLIGLVHVTSTRGVELAWAAPALAAVLVIGAVLRGRTSRTGRAPTLPPIRELGGFAAGEYLTGLLTEIVPLVLPLIVVTRLGTVANAYLAVPWMVGAAVTMLFWNISGALIAEAAHDERQARPLMLRALRLCAVIGVGAAAVLVVAAPWLLDLLGGDYSRQGVGVVRLIAAGFPFTVVVVSFTSMARINRNIGRVVLVQALTAVVTVGVAAVLIGRLGIDAVGVGSLCGQAATALVVIWPLVRGLRGDVVEQPRPTAGRSGLMTPALADEVA